MPAPTQSSTPFEKNTVGRDFNFYEKIEVSSPDFNEKLDVIITFSTQSVMMLLENTTGIVEYSFNGNTVHGELNSALPSRAIAFDNRVISKIWFRIKSGSPSPLTVRVDAWGKQ
jgi:hypothetical protein